MVEFLRYSKHDNPFEYIDVMFRNGYLNIEVESVSLKYRGRCQYDIRQEVLEVHELTAQPEGSGLGAVLMHATAIRAGMLGCRRIRTTATAQSAMKFYLNMGLHPEPLAPPDGDPLPMSLQPSDQAAMEDFGMKLLIGRMMTADWSGERNDVARLAEESFRSKWKFCKHYAAEPEQAMQPRAGISSSIMKFFHR